MYLTPVVLIDQMAELIIAKKHDQLGKNVLQFIHNSLI